MKLKDRIKEREINGKTYFTAYVGRVEGKPVVLTRADRKDLERELERRETRSKRIGKEALRLTDGQLRDAVQALDMLDGRHTLTDAVQFMLDHTSGEGGSATVAELFEAYKQDRRRAHRSERTIYDIQQRLGGFADDFSDTPVHSVTTTDLERWLAEQNGGAVNARNYRVHLSGLFNFAMKRRHIRFNPASTLTTPSIRQDRRPAILSVSDARKLMAAVQEHADCMTPYFGLCLFAGLRPAEAQRISWEDIDFDRGEIFVSSKVSKTGNERYVTMQPNLIEWLLPHRQKSGGVFFSRHYWELARQKAKIDWGHDILRHSFGSYHLAAFRNAGDTAEQMGHGGSTTMLFKHYRRAVRESDGAKFWEIAPTAGGKIVAFGA